RTIPIIVDGRPFLTYKEASRYLLSLTPGAREKAFAEMSNGAAGEVGSTRNSRPPTRCEG
ncbi:MAG: hypothetical protein FP826_11490, partial [Sphingomonadales bacterium]|nr:hypothetical protein [Sphingomonadales bacterium]